MIEKELIQQLDKNLESAQELLSHDDVNWTALHALANEEARLMDGLRAVWSAH